MSEVNIVPVPFGALPEKLNPEAKDQFVLNTPQGIFRVQWAKLQEFLQAGSTQITDFDNPPQTGNVWGLVHAGTYPALGNITVADGTFAFVQRIGGVWSSRVIQLEKGKDGKDGKTIEDWSAKSYTAGSLVFKDGKIWKNTADAATTDVPGNATLWVEKMGSANFSELTNPGSEVYVYGTFIPSGGTPAATGYGMLDKGFTVPSNSKISKIKVRVYGTGTISVKVLTRSGNSYSVRSSTDIQVVDGDNTVDVNIPVNKGEKIGLTQQGTLQLSYLNGSGIFGPLDSVAVTEMDGPTGSIVPNVSFTIDAVPGGLIYELEKNTPKVAHILNPFDDTNVPTSKAIDVAFNAPGYKADFRYGYFTGLMGSTSSANLQWFVNDLTVLTDTLIKQVKVNIDSAADAYIRIFKLSGSNYVFDREQKITLSAGVNLVDVSIPVYRGEVIAIKASAGVKFIEGNNTSDKGNTYNFGNNSIPAAELKNKSIYLVDFAVVLEKKIGGQLWELEQKLAAQGLTERVLDKSIMFIGDSNTAVGSWVPKFLSYIKFKKGNKNLADSGARFGMTGMPQDWRLRNKSGYGQMLIAESDPFFIPDIILINLGTNDIAFGSHSASALHSVVWNQNVNYLAAAKADIMDPLFDGMTGGMRLLFDKIYSLYPDADVYVITPTGDNNNMEATYAMGKSIKEGAFRSGIPVLDLMGEGRINFMNSGKFKVDPLHTNDLGDKLEARFVADKIWRIYKDGKI